MASKILLFLFSIFLSMVGVKALAYDFSAENADGVTIYYNYINDGKELEVTCFKTTHNWDAYTGNIVIPSEVSFMNKKRIVTQIGDYAFTQCMDLLSVSIPNSVTKIGHQAFTNCTNLTSFTIPEGVTSIGDWALYGCSGLTSIVIPSSIISIGSGAFNCENLISLISLIENPFKIFGASSDRRTFNLNTFFNVTLYVPKGTIDKYKATEGWMDFSSIEVSNGSVNPTNNEKCEKPTISYLNGKLIFNSATEGVTFQSVITDADINSYNSNEVQLMVTYNISVYATKEGYQNSEIATATLCWIDVEPKTEGITDGIAQMPARAVMVKAEGGQLIIEGADDNTNISVYNIDGVQLGTSTRRNGVALINTPIPKSSVTIVKIGNKSVKVMMK